MSDNKNLDIELIDLLDLINETLNITFIEKWRFRYSEKFVKLFQYKILESIEKQKPIKVLSLFNYLHKRCSYNKEQILDFFESIDIELYYPIILGKLKVS